MGGEVLIIFINKDLHDWYKREKYINYLFPPKENLKYLIWNTSS